MAIKRKSRPAPQKFSADRSGKKPASSERPQRPEHPRRAERTERSERPQSSERPDRPQRADRPERSDRPRRPERSDRGERSERVSPAARARNPDRYERPLREDLVLQASLEAYGAVRHEGRLSDRALDFVLRHKKNLYSNERRAVAERVYGLLRRQRTVDFLLYRAHPRFDSLDKTRQDVLRLATSRVLYGEPLDVVVRTSSLAPGDAAALGALPEAAAALEALPERERFPIAASLPDFLADLFRKQFGRDAARAAEAMNERAPLTARVNLLKGDRDALAARLKAEGVGTTPAPLSPMGLMMESRLNIFALETFREGFLEIQDEGSQLLGMLVDAPPTRVVDACAGAGGKTLQLAAQMKNRGDLHALDVDERRMEDLKKRARRAGVHNVRAQLIPHEGPEADAALEPLKGKADRVLVDAPCSGTGTFRRKPDARYRLTPEDLEMHVGRQKALLARFAMLVKPGGRLIYGTCSVLRAENEDVIEDFLSKHPDFTTRPVAELLGPELGAKVGPGPYLRLAPHTHGTDGFFGAVLVRAK
jgi:16S rRNA (cytosine967-C5)-methyltransferase